MSEIQKFSQLHKISFFLLLVSIFLLPIFFIPVLSIPLGVSKAFVFSTLIIFSFVFWLLARLVDGEFVIPKDFTILAVIFVPLLFFISSFFSPSTSISIFGYGFDIGTVNSILVSFVAFFLSVIHFQDKKNIQKFFLAFFASFVVVELFALSNLIFGFTNNSNFFSGLSSSNLVGTWNDLGAISGLVILVSLIGIELLSLNKYLKILFFSNLTLSMLFLATVNFFSLWMTIGVFALIIFVYILSINHSSRKEKTNKNFPVASFVVVILCLSFITANNFFGDVFPSIFNVSNIEIRPSVEGTLSVAKETLSSNPVFGSGPSFFGQEWLKYRLESVNSTIFWNTSFENGFSTLLTFLVTAGILGFLSFVSFVLFFFYRGVMLSFSSNNDNEISFLSISSFLSSVYLWVMVIAYTPGIAVFSLAFIMSGIFIGLSVYKKDIKIFSFSFLKDPRMSFFSILIIVFFMLGSVSLGYVYIKKFASVVLFERGTLLARTNTEDGENLKIAENKLIKAIDLSSNDLYYRTLSEIYLMQFSDLIRKSQGVEESVKTDLQTKLSQAEQSARLAVEFNNSNYLNWISLGYMYESVISSGVENAYENAVSSYQKALEYNPHSPSIYLAMARVEVQNKNTEKAFDFINQAFAKKKDYLDAFYFLSELHSSLGDEEKSLSVLEEATKVIQDSSTLFAKLGVSYYNNKNYINAVSVLEKAVNFSPLYGDARYVLALAYGQIGDYEKSKDQLSILSSQFPDNENIKLLIEKIEKGESIFEKEVSVESDEENEE